MKKKYEKGHHTIFYGDALEVLPSEIPSNSVDLVFADPPYNLGKRFSNFHDKWPSDLALTNVSEY